IIHQARRKGLELTLAIDPEVPLRLRGDPSRLRQILLNLLSNAIKFTEHGEIHVAVNKISADAHEAGLRFRGHDNGLGIPTEKPSLLFHPFTQLETSTSHHYGGTGLGLSIVRELVEAMHGTIAVISRLGEGSPFSFTTTLPRKMDHDRPAPRQIPPRPGNS